MIIKQKDYIPQKGDKVKFTFWKPTLIECIVGLAILILVGVLYLSFTTRKEEVQSIKDLYDIKAQELYDNLYDNNWEIDYDELIQTERTNMLDRIEVGKGVIMEGYWFEAKKEASLEMKEVVETYPEITEDVIELPKPVQVTFTAQNNINDLHEYLSVNFPTSPMNGIDIEQICKDSNIEASQCRLGLAIIRHESKYGTAYAGGRPDLGNVIYHNYAGVKCDTRLAKLKPCNFPDENGMWITKFNSPESFLEYFFEQIIGKNWGVCKTTACMSPKYVAPMNERNMNWETKINNEMLNLHFINY